MKSTSELRGILFRHLDGITTVPVAYSLHKKGVLDYILQQEKVTLKEIAEKLLPDSYGQQKKSCWSSARTPRLTAWM